MTPEQKESINRFICEWMGECWHEWLYFGPSGLTHDYRCRKCGLKSYTPVKPEDGSTDYFTPEGFFAIWNRAKEDIQWVYFWDEIRNYSDKILPLIDPQVFPLEWAKYLGWPTPPAQ